jgi:hypothetical protein
LILTASIKIKSTLNSINIYAGRVNASGSFKFV